MWRVIWAYLLYTWGGLHRYFGIQNSVPREHERAIHYFSRALEVNPAFDDARLARGVLLYRELGRIEDGIADFDALLAEQADYGPALFNRAVAHQTAGRYEQALSDLERYLALPERDAYYRNAVHLKRLLEEIVAREEEG